MNGFQGALFINSCCITNTDQVAVDVTDISINIKIFEDINQPFLSGRITLVDGVNLLKNYKFTGQESITIDVSQAIIKEGKIAKATKANSIRHTFRIYSITDGNRIREFVDKAYLIATNGYPGAVHLSVPVDIMFSSFPENAGLEERPFSQSKKIKNIAWPDPNQMSEVLKLASNSKKPMLIGGHGVWWSGSEKKLEAAGQNLNIPIFNVPYHQKLLGEEAKSYMGLADIHQYPPSKFAFDESDLILMVGTRLDNQMNFGNPPLFPKSTKIICINGSHEEIELNRAADINMLCDPGVFLDTLSKLKVNNKWNLDNKWIEQNISEKKNWIEQDGMEWDYLDLDEIEDLEPAFKTDKNTKKIVGGIYTKSDASGDIHKFCVNLHKVLEDKYKLVAKFNSEVETIYKEKDCVIVSISDGNITEGLKFDKVAICAGVDTQKFANVLGDRMQVYPVKGYSVTINLNDQVSQEAAPKVSLIDDPVKIVSSRLGNRLRVAGTAELAGYNKDIRQDRVRPLLNWVKKYFPDVSTESYTPWAGLRPMTPDMMPLLFESNLGDIFYNTGHGHLGWTLSAETAEILAKKILNET